MGTNIKRADMDEMAEASKELVTKGMEVASHIKDAYDVVAEMGQYWQGPRYAELCEHMNEIRPKLVANVKQAAEELPKAMYTATGNYKMNETGEYFGLSGTFYNEPVALSASADAVVVFIESSITQCAYKFDLGLSQARSKLMRMRGQVKRFELAK